MPAAHDVYADQLRELRRGYALYYPEPHPEEGPVEIGDVGFTKQGAFYRLFNVSRPPDDPAQRYGVPEHFERLDMGVIRTFDRALEPGPLHSKTVSTLEADIGTPGVVLPVEASFRFNCTSKRGAILMLETQMMRQDAVQDSLLESYLQRHCLSWHAFARSNHITVGFGDLMLVTECSKTGAWSSAVYSNNVREFGLGFSIGAPFLPSAAGISASASVERVGPVERRRSEERALPEGTPPVKNHTIFLKAYRLGIRQTYYRSMVYLFMKTLDPRARENMESPGTNRIRSVSAGETSQAMIAPPPGANALTHLETFVLRPDPPDFHPALPLLGLAMEMSDSECVVVHDDIWCSQSLSPDKTLIVEQYTDFHFNEAFDFPESPTPSTPSVDSEDEMSMWVHNPRMPFLPVDLEDVTHEMEQARSASRLALLVPRATSRTNAVSRFSRALLAAHFEGNRAPETNPYDFDSPTPEVPRTDVGEGTQNSAWAPRPPAGDVYRLLAEFFPEHDLDNPHVGLDSEGSSAAASEGATATSRSGLGPAEGTQSQTKRPITTRITSQSIRAVQDSSFSGVPFEWALGALIGRGTYGYVYFALDTTDQKIIAVKQIDIPRTTNAQQSIIVNSLKIQRSKMEDLHHPNIVQSFGFAETKDFEERSHKLSIFLEYIPGGSIRSALAQYGKFNEDVTKSFTGQILAGLEYIHSKGIIHHDLKADNILVNMSGECKLSDYGLWKRTEEDIGGAIPGMKSVFWMAPEVYNGRKDGHNFKIDIWSVGCVTLEMWTGMRPWNGEEIMGVMYKLRLSKQPPVPVNVVLSELADGFRKECFMINPDERPTATELREHSYLALPPDWSFTDFQ